MANLTNASEILIWLLVVNLGIAFGAGIYEHHLVVPRWIIREGGSTIHWNSTAARLDDTGRKFWVFVTTIPLTLLTLANIYVAWHSSGGIRSWWLAAGCAAFADRLVTFSYFIPTMIGLMKTPDSPQSVATARRWSNANYLRHAIVLAAWLLSLKAFSVFYQQSV